MFVLAEVDHSSGACVDAAKENSRKEASELRVQFSNSRWSSGVRLVLLGSKIVTLTLPNILLGVIRLSQELHTLPEPTILLGRSLSGGRQAQTVSH